MTASFAARIAIKDRVIIIRGGWTGTRYTPAQPKRQGLGAICSSCVAKLASKITGYRIREGKRAGDRVLRSLNGPVLAFNLPAILRRALQACKQSARCVSNRFQGFAPFIHASKMDEGSTPWNEKVFPNPARVLSRIK